MGTIRVATWNMDHWKRSENERVAAWDFLRDRVQPTVALLQETIPPPSRKNVVFREGGIGGRRPWGSAVLSDGPTLEALETLPGKKPESPWYLHQTFPGSVAIAQATVAPGTTVTFVSIHAITDMWYYSTTVHRVLSDLALLFDSPAGKWVILGGDFNSSTQLESPYGEWDATVFQRLEAYGLVDLTRLTSNQRTPLPDCPCPEAPICHHIQTHRHPQSRKPWQDDYLFCTPNLADRLESYDTITEGDPDPWSLSDHCPLVAEFEL